jgi:hypothetical protein
LSIVILPNNPVYIVQFSFLKLNFDNFDTVSSGRFYGQPYPIVLNPTAICKAVSPSFGSMSSYPPV